MKQLSHFISLVFLLINLTSQAQSDIQQDWRVDPLLKQVHAKRPGLRMFGRRDDGGRYVTMAVLEENARKLKWFTCYGVVFDSVQLRADEYNEIITGTLDPFTFYRSYCHESLSYIEQAETLYRIIGKAALQDTTQNNRLVFNAAPVKMAQSTLQKLMAIEGLMTKICLQLRLFDSRTPQQLAIKKNDSSHIRQDYAGKMVRKVDSTEYFNTNPLANAAKIVLRRESANRFFVYNQEGELMDSVPLKPGKYASLLDEKEDVFLLYRGWLELGWQQALDGKRQYASWLYKLDSSLYSSVSWEQNKRLLQDLTAGLQERQVAIDDKISRLIVPEEKYVERLVADFYKNETSEISYLPGLGFAYTISYILGQKKYELTDHRGNIMAIVSDKKKGLDENMDDIVEYYNADVVNANDYYPFGSLIPGRTFSSEDKYRFGYNGKENDNEVKGDGNQQDYGMRIYDPRLGRFLSVDPLTGEYPWNSTYAYAEGDPINYEDIDGLERPITRSAARITPTRPALGNTYLTPNGNLVRIRPVIGSGSPPNLMPNEGVARSYRGYYVTTPNGGYYVPDTRREVELRPYRTPQQFQFDNLGDEAQTARYYFERDINSEKPMTGNAQIPVLPLLKTKEDDSNQGKAIGLGLDEDLRNHRGTGAIIYKNAGWQTAGLTKIDWGRASSNRYYFFESFQEAAKNATNIRFDVSNFDPASPKNNYTYEEFQHIISNPALLGKTTFIRDNKEVKWNGSKFVDND